MKKILVCDTFNKTIDTLNQIVVMCGSCKGAEEAMVNLAGTVIEDSVIPALESLLKAFESDGSATP